MPRYDYYCENCGLQIEAIHSINECDNPSEETQKEICCNANNCPVVNDLQYYAEKNIYPEYGRPFKREICAPNIHGVVGGSSVGQRGVLLKKQQEKKLRSRKHFKKEVLPTLDGSDKQHFEKKYKDLDARGRLK